MSLDLSSLFEAQKSLNDFYHSKYGARSPWKPWMADPELEKLEWEDRFRNSPLELHPAQADEYALQSLQKERVEAAQKFITAINQEMNGELLDSLAWEWWKNYKAVDWQNVRVEIVDVLHFFLSLCMICKVSPQDLFDTYFKKNAVNKDRQKDGYVVKNPDDTRSL